jgi:hypothetical protein
MANGLHFYPNHLKKLRIPKTSENEPIVSEIIALVHRILADHLTTSEYCEIESEIDSKIFKLFGFSEEEQFLVQGELK